VVVGKATGRAVLETTDRKKAEAVNRDKFDVVPIGEYLASLNKPAEAPPAEPLTADDYLERAREFVRDSTQPLTVANLNRHTGAVLPEIGRDLLKKLAAAGEIIQGKDGRFRRKARQQKPQTFTQFVAQLGGLARRHRAEVPDAPRLVPGYGPLFRRDGLDPDSVREAAIEAGYLREDAELNDVFRLLDDENRGQKHFAGADEAAVEQARQERELERDDERAYEALEAINDQATADEVTLTDQELQQAVRHMLVDGLDASHAIESAVMSAGLDALEANPTISEPVSDDDIPFDDFGEAPAAAEPSEGAPAGEQAGAGARPPERQPEAEAGVRPPEQERPQAGAEGGKAEVAPPPAPKAEPGAEGLPQLILPGAEPSAQQAMKAREGKGKKAKAPQKKADEGIFAPPPDTRQEDIEEAAKAPPAPAPAPPKRPAGYGSGNKLVSTEEADAIRARLRAKAKSQLSAGVDPEMLLDGIRLGVYHLEAGTRAFVDWARAMIDDLGEWVEPYLDGWYEGARRFPGIDRKGLTAPEEVERVLSRREYLEPDRREPAPGHGLGEADVSAAAGRARPGAGEGGGEAAGEPGAAEGGRGLPDRDAALLGAGGDSGLPGEDTGWNPSLAERGEPGGGGGAGEPGLPTDSAAAGVAKELTLGPTRLADRAAEQKKADKTPVKTADLDNIRATLPLLQPEQQEDVFKAETRYGKPDGHGFMLTNGTGTGKTWSGMGVIKRLHLQGKTNILIVAPSQGILDNWVETGAAMGVPISKLESTTTAGKGTVATTYANLQENRTLGDRDWELVVADEAHKLMQKQDGSETDALRALRALTLHPDRLLARADMRLGPLLDEIAALQAKAKQHLATPAEIKRSGEALRELSDKRKQIEGELQTKPRGKALFLSATPFAYAKTVDYGQGYLFAYPKVKAGGYNAPDARGAFFIENFGFRMRTGKLTEPEAGVDSEIMERAFHEKLKQEGALSGRALTVDKDYDRKFILVDDAVGNRIDQALDWLSQKASPLNDLVRKRFDYLARMRLLEAIKARHAIPIIKQHMALGRKIVVFHDYNEGGGFNPFDLDELKKAAGGDVIRVNDEPVRLQDLHDEFVDANPYVKQLDFAGFLAPIAELTKAFPDALVYNGQVSTKKRTEAKRLFNTDGSGRDLIIVQSAAGEAGISLHDTTGKHQRVTLNLGMPVRPVTAIQEEGRIYRVGQKTNAIQRYFNSGTSWERWTFAGKIAERSGTAENLAMGDEARTLKQAFVEAFQAAEDYPPSKDEGTGGKEADKARSSTISPFQRAKTYYYGQQKQRGRRDQREGLDYFPTPEPVGMKMGEWADIKINDDVLEPSAGHGAIARFLPQLANRTLVEPAPELASRAALASPGAGVLNERFEDLNIVRKYDAIVMNPPYGVGGKTALEHLDKAAKHLRNGGRIVALLPEGGKATERYDAWLEAHPEIHPVADMKMPRVLFERAGTQVASHVVVLEKQTDAEVGRKIQTSHRDFSDAESINDLFDRIEEQTVKPRLEPKTKELKVTEQPTASGGAGISKVTAGGVEFRLEGQGIAVPLAKLGRARFVDVAKVAEQNSGYYAGGAFFFPDDAKRTAFLTALENPPAAPAPGAMPAATFINGETVHGKTGEKLFVASLVSRLDSNDYTRVNEVAKQNGGWYSSFKGRGAVPGFQFKSESARAAFLARIAQGPSTLLGSSTRLRMGTDRLVRGAEEMASWRTWYDRHKEAVGRIFGDDAGLFQQLLSATSQSTAVKGNVTLALKAYDQLKRGQPFTGYLGGVKANLERIRAGQAVQGAKIGEFAAANRGVEEAIAVDRHIDELMFGTSRPTSAQITKAKSTVQQVAKRLGWSPRQTQAALWAFNQVRRGLDPAQVQSYDTILEARADEIAALRAAFADVEGAGAGLPAGGAIGAGAEAGPTPAGATTGATGLTGEVEPAGTIASIVGSITNDPAFNEVRDDVQREIARLIGQIAGPEAEVAVYDQLKARMSGGGEVPLTGGFVGDELGGVIAVALEDSAGTRLTPAQVSGVARHEALHFLRRTGAIPDEHWQALEAKAGQWRQLFGVDEDPAYRELGEAVRNEEGIAKAYDAWSQGRLKVGPAENTALRWLQRIYRAVATALRNALGLQSLPTAQEVFEALERGEFAGRRGEQAIKDRQMLASTGLGPGAMTTPVDLREQMRQLSALNYGLLQKALRPGMRGKSGHVFDHFRRIFQDRFLFVRRAEEAAEAALGRPLDESERAYLAEEGYYSKVGDHKLRLEKDYFEPIVKLMHDHGIKREEVDEYLMAKHAEERNAQIASINPLFPATGPDAAKYGSGMTDEEARNIKAGIPPAKQAAFDEIHDLVRGMLEQRLDWLVQSGLMSADEAAAYRATYDDYVPLRGVEADPLAEDEDALKFSTGRGFMGSRAKEKRAFGRQSRAPDVLATAMAMADASYVRGEKNLVAQALLNLARAAPDPKVWSVNPREREAYLAKDRRTGVETVRYRYRPHYSGQNTVSVRVGGREFRIELKDDYLLRAFSKMGGGELGPVLGQLSRITGLLSKLNTMYSPEFLVANAQMDFETAMVNLGREDLPRLRRDVTKLWNKARRGTVHYLRTGKTDTPFSAYAAEFRRAGGATAFNAMSDVGTMQLTVDKALKQLNSARGWRKAGPWLMGLIEDANTGVDNAVRLATYVALRQRGYSPAKAASAAKNLTINFNRKGEAGPAMNALWMFANAGTQGTAVLASALMRSAKVRRFVYGTIALGAVSELLAGALPPPDDDDKGDGRNMYDQIKEWEKSQYMIIPYGIEPGQYVKIRMPYGYAFFHNLGRLMAAYVRGAPEDIGKPVSLGETTVKILSAFATNMIPPGLGDTLVPTVAQPFIDLASNKDWLDRPIKPPVYPGDVGKPESQRYYQSVSPISRKVAELLNAGTGGNEFRPGLIDISPEAFSHIVSTYAGGAGRILTQTGNQLWQAGWEAAGGNVEDPKLTWKQLPFIRKAIGSANPYQARDVTYQRMGEIETLADEADSEDKVFARQVRKDNRRLLALTDDSRKLRRELGRIRKQKIAIKANDKLTVQAKRQRIDALEKREAAMSTRFNRAYLRALRGPTPAAAPPP
jgi:Large polyvalent protein associated domain 38/Type III restriction enzyme, res subunit